MRILIAYAGKSGTSQQGAELLAGGLTNHEVTVADLRQQMPSPDAFDHVVIGGSIRFGKAHRALRAYLKKYSEALCRQAHSVFLCCGIPEQFEHYLAVTFSKALLESAKNAVYFGGELDVSKQHGFLDKLVARMMRNAIRESEDDEAGLPGLLPEHVRMLADRLRGK